MQHAWRSHTPINLIFGLRPAWIYNGTPLQYSCLEIPWTEEPAGLQSMGSLRVGHNWATALSLFTFMHWRRKWQPTPVFLPGESQGQRRLLRVHGVAAVHGVAESPWAAVHGVTKSWTRLSDFTFTFHFHALEKAMATRSSVLAWRLPGMGEPCGLPPMGSHRVRHDWSDIAAAALTFKLHEDVYCCQLLRMGMDTRPMYLTYNFKMLKRVNRNCHQKKGGVDSYIRNFL